MDYLDFELEIGLGEGREYPVAVVRSPAGEARETMHFPYDELALESRLDKLQIALLRSGGRRRRALSPEQKAVQDFGRDLFDALFTGEVRNRYDVSRERAAQQSKGLRLKLRIQPSELAARPWEYLHDPREAEYVCLSRDTPVVRYLELPRPPQPLTVTPPLRILGMVVSPKDLEPLDVMREKQRLEEAIKVFQEDGLVELAWLEGQTWRDLQRAMRKGPWHVFHFIGHGGFDRNADEGFIALADEWDETQRLLATQLGRLLANHRSLQLVLLNSCEGARGGTQDIFSSSAAILVRRGIPAVVAMQYEITDRAAIEFARTFYESLADGFPVDAAVTEARTAISLAVNNTMEWGVPVLYMRAPDGVLFNVRERKQWDTRQKAAERASVPTTEEVRRPRLLPQVNLFRLRQMLSNLHPGWIAGVGLATLALIVVVFLLAQGIIGGSAIAPMDRAATATRTATAVEQPAQTVEEVAAEVEEETAAPTVEEEAATEQPVETVAPLQFRSRLGPGRISNIVFNPDGDILAVASSVDVRLYDSDTFELVRDLKVSTNSSVGWLGSVTWSPDGTRLAGHVARVIVVWDASSGAEIHTLEGHTHPYVRGLAWSPDSTRLASGSWDETVRVWDAVSGDEMYQYDSNSLINSVAWSPDGTLLAFGGYHTVWIWDPTGSQEPHVLLGHQGSVLNVAWSPDGIRLASCSGDNTVRVWDVASGVEQYLLEGHVEPVEEVAWSPDGTRLASGGWDGTVRVWDTMNGTQLHVLEGHSGTISRLRWSPDGTRLASGSFGDGTARIWDAATGDEQLRLTGYIVVWSPDGNKLVTGNSAGTVRVYDSVSGAQLHRLEDHTGWIDSVTWSPDGTKLASGSGDTTVRIWDAASGKELRRLKGHTSWVASVAWSPDGSRLASGGWDDTVRVWDAASGEELQILAGHTAPVLSIAWSPDTSQLASGSRDNTVRVWDVASGEEENILKGHSDEVASVAWSPDGTLLASGSDDNTVWIWDVASGGELRQLTGHTSGVASVAWSPDGTLLASGGWDDTVRVWDAARGTELQILEGWRGYSVAWAPDGSRLASVDDNFIHLWDLASGEPYVEEFPGGESVAWSRDGTRLAFGSADGTVWVWNVIEE